MANNFAETRNLFTLYTQYVEPLTFDQWNDLPEDRKSAVLFVQFYDEITLAWYKLSFKAPWVPDEDGVSCVCQYLEKNVKKIEDDPKRFTSAYIYQVAYNCIYCITIDPPKPRERAQKEVNHIAAGSDGTEYDLYDTASTLSAEEELELKIYKNMFWKVIEDSGLETQKVVNYLLNDMNLTKVSKRSKMYEVDPLRDVEVKLEDVEKIIVDLRVKLEKFRR